VMSNQ